LSSRPHALDCAAEVGLLPTHADPLRPAGDVWRVVATRGGAFRGQRLFDRAGGGAFPIRAHDVDGAETELWVAQLGEERAHALEPELLGPGGQALDVLNRG